MEKTKTTMSIKQRQKEVEVLKPLKTETTLETKTTYETDRKTKMSISLLSGTTANTNSSVYSSSTHIGLTKDRDIKTENRIKAGRNIYTITYVNNDGRYSTVFLSLVK